VEKALPDALREEGVRLLPMLDRRLDALAAWVDGTATTLSESRQERAVTRRFLASVKGDWDDGDESLVRGFLDGWTTKEQDAGRAAARSVLAAAEALGRIQTRAQTLWFFLWEMESVWVGLTGGSSLREGHGQESGDRSRAAAVSVRGDPR